MARRKDHELDRLAERVSAALERDTDALVDRLKAELFDDLEHVSEPKFLDYVRQQAAADPQYLPKLYQQVGARAFNAIYDQAFVPRLEAPLDVPALSGAAGAVRLEPDGQGGV